MGRAFARQPTFTADRVFGSLWTRTIPRRDHVARARARQALERAGEAVEACAAEREARMEGGN